MTTPDERTKALLLAGELLAKLASPVKSPDVPDAIRKQAQHILRNYPSRGDIGYLAEDAERGAFIAGPMLDATAAGVSDGIQNFESDKKRIKTPLEKVADNSKPVLIFIAVAFTLCAPYLFLSLTCEIGLSFC